MIVDAFNENKRDRELQNNLSILGEERKYYITRDEDFALTDTDIYPLPLRYNETYVVFMVRDPNCALPYWDVEEQHAQVIKANEHFEQLLLRVYDVELVDFDGTNANSFFDIPIQFADLSWYIYLPHQNCSYVLDLSYLIDNRFHCLCRSNVIKTPRRTPPDFTLSGSGVRQNQLADETSPSYSSLGNIPQRIINKVRER